MDLLRHFQWGLACLLAATMIVPPAASARSPSAPAGAAADEPPRPADPGVPPYFIILDAPADFDALLQRIQRPDLEVRAVDRARPGAEGPAAGGKPAAPAPWVVESVRIRGRVGGDSAALRVEMAIATAAEDVTWVPIRLDGQRLIDAREGSRILDLKTVAAGRWQVGLAGAGTHRIAVDLRCPITTRPARASLSLAIPEAPSTSLELDFDRRQPDLIIGDNEVYGQADLPGGQGSRLSARLSPRSRVDVSWVVEAGPGGPNPPLLTAQGDIAIDIDSEQMRTRSSWVIRCVRGMTRTLELQVADDDEVTELRLDDQEAGAGIEGGRGAGRLTIPLPEPLRPGAEHRLVLKTRRSYARAAGHRIEFVGFPIVNAREQSGAIGVTQGPNLWVAPVSSRGLRRIIPTFLPRELAERPGTSLAFEFLEQPFALGLDVEESPPLVRSRSRTLLRLEADRARSETTIELQWVRGRPFEVELALGPGLQVAAVGPPAVVEAWNLTGGASSTPGGVGPHGLTIRLAPTVRDQSKVTLQLEGSQRLPRDGPVRLGLFAPDATTAVSSSFSVAVDRSLSVELDDDPARAEGSDRPAFRIADASGGRPVSPSGGEPGGRALSLEAGGAPRTLPLRIARHARSVRQETVVSAEVARRSIETLQRTTFTVRHGTLAAPVVRVPEAIDGRWKLREREVVEREELGRDPDGSRRYRLFLDRPILDRSTLEFRWQLPLGQPLDAATDRPLEVPRISFPEAEAGPTRVELVAKPGVVVREVDPSWTLATPSAPTGPAVEAGLSYVEGSAGKGRPFRFRAVALEPVAMPALLAPRLLIRSSLGLDDAIQYRASYWVEAHGPAFPFELPEAARIIAARVGGRAAERVDLEGQGDGHRRYRLRLPADMASRPVLVELEYQVEGPPAAATWRAPRLLEDGVVLQTLWEVRLPWDRALLGVPPGWSDENEWDWGGNQWVRRPSKDGAALGAWLLGDGAPPSAVEDLRDGGLDGFQHLLFGRSAGAAAEGSADSTGMSVRIVSRPWLVAACSGATLLVGFLAIFSRIRFKTAWAVAAGVGLLAAAMLQPSMAAQLAQASLMGAALTSLGLLIQHSIDRRRSPTIPVREPTSGIGATREGSSMNRVATVGSDDPTAIRVRTPSTMDYVPTPLAGASAPEESRSSTLGRT